ncbi:ribonuclease HII [Methylopila henanensis]|uniref:Ribonuclease HII n=1 Tax=Methylopila henanensis TaxID=873516 RepID=A0ABW4K6V1_9HYPH
MPPLKPPRPTPYVATFERERALIAAGCGPVAGVDEAGRGPLAGPVVAAAVILDPDRIPAGLADSKALSAQRREALFENILATSTVSFVSASTARIEQLNIRGATLWAMRQALGGLATQPDVALIDGRDVPPGLACRGEAVIAGDAQVLSIAAASIVAKVVRDRMMRRVAVNAPGYGFERHMGYCTPEHLAALAALGPCPHHRRGFAPVAALLAAAAE